MKGREIKIREARGEREEHTIEGEKQEKENQEEDGYWLGDWENRGREKRGEATRKWETRGGVIWGGYLI